MATLNQLHSFVGFEQAQLRSKLPTRRAADTCGVSSQGKSSGLKVVAAINDRGEVMAVRDTHRNDGYDVGSTVQSGHLIPSPRIAPQLKDAQLKTLTTCCSFVLVTSSDEVRILYFQNLLTHRLPLSFSACFKNLLRTGLVQRRSDILKKPTRVLQEVWHSFSEQGSLDFSSSNFEFQER